MCAVLVPKKIMVIITVFETRTSSSHFQKGNSKSLHTGPSTNYRREKYEKEKCVLLMVTDLR